jgi:two-component system invasion response regulator UvrY
MNGFYSDVPNPEPEKISSGMLSILIADDHQIVRRGLKHILTEGFPFAQIEEASDTPEMLRKAGLSKYDIIISDLNMPGGGGMEGLRVISATLPEVPVLILSIYPAEQYALRVLAEGGFGYLNKDAAPDELVKAVQIILTGKKYITSDIEQQLSQLKRKDGQLLHTLLSDREMEVFKLIASGHSLGQVAEILQIALPTVSTYRLRILSKLNLKTNADLTEYALRFNLI